MMMGSCRCCVDRSILHQLCLVPDRRVPVGCPECGEPCLNTACAHIKSHPSPILALNAVFEWLINTGAPETRVEWSVENHDGNYGMRFAPDGPVEVWLIGYESAVDRSLMAGRWISYRNGTPWRRCADPMLICLPFETYVQAQVAGAAFADALKMVDKVRETWPCDGDDCAEFGHIVKLERFSRQAKMRAVCERCMVVLKDEVHPLEYGHLPHGVTVAQKIEAEVNR